ncbi:interleukin-27 receptor subunit alpha isoform X2 [Pseudophryne corroboree]|uniref:interleukin-27 receptor subunit alpha isoform X2 n=1 Tax=Pseudophryne corroboree TaxID=495146 RepID=UPI00308173E2
MSDSFWIRPIAGGIFILIISVCYSNDFADLCSFCCIIQGKIEDLNCTWRSAQRTASLQSLTNPKDPPRHFTLQPGQKWLLLPRENLTYSHRYHLRVSGGDKEEALIFTYSHDGENVFIRPPALNSSVSEDMTVEVFWENPADSPHPLLVELRYRILGDSSWTLANESDLEVNAYSLDDPEPYTKYEFQIRYLPDEQQKNRGSLWSESYVLTTPEDVPTGTLDVWRSLEKWPLLLIMWKPLSPQSARGEILNYHVVFSGTESKITEALCCSMIMPAQTTHVCVSARNSKGLGNGTCLTPLCSGISLFGGRAWGDASGRINVWWEEPLSPRLPLSYLVEWREDGNKQLNWTRSQTANQTLILPDVFTTGVLYHISVFALKDDECVANLSTETYSLEGVPSASPNFFIHVLTSTEAVISWDEIPVQHRRGNLKHYSIYVNSTDRYQHHKVYSGNETLSGLSPGTVYTVWMTATTTAGEGPPSTGKTFQTTAKRSWKPSEKEVQ